MTAVHDGVPGGEKGKRQALDFNQQTTKKDQNVLTKVLKDQDLKRRKGVERWKEEEEEVTRGRRKTKSNFQKEKNNNDFFLFSFFFLFFFSPLAAAEWPLECDG